MANQTQNPFADEKPKIVHFEKNESHYEYCRMQMHDIERVHKRTFLVNMVLCIFVCLLAVFHVYIAGFDLLSHPFADIDKPGAILTGGIFQIVFGMFAIILGYLAWANFHTLNIILGAWYAVVTLIGIFRLDYLSALVGIVGAVFYFFSIKEMGHEAQLAEMEGYPDFQEKFDISQSDIVIQTLLSHKGEHRTKSTLFTTDYSLRRKKKKRTVPGEEPEQEQSSASEALAEELKKHLEAKQAKAKSAEGLEAARAEANAQFAETAAKAAAMKAEAEPAAKPEAETEPAAKSEAEADAILAEAEAKARAILAEAAAKAEQMKAEAAAEAAAQMHQAEQAASKTSDAAKTDAPQKQSQNNSQNRSQNQRRKKRR